MLMEDAAGSSVNFQQKSAGFGSIAHSSMVRESTGTRQIMYQSLGSIGTPLREKVTKKLASDNIHLGKNDSQVMMGSGEIESAQDEDLIVEEAYQ